ncbi:MAG: 5'-nucleotidase C-terminal domain-containing protein [Clostridia bacterium]|nr:5'-nucleotidase C-terminal domain-containing protein [Clostridia bacterium]
MGTIDLTLLHINDIHGDFISKKADNRVVGGLALLSGYIKRTRHNEKNVIFAVAGDMFKGSIIDSEYRGLSTIELMNRLSPDVATIGNHEVDYGLSHLLFLEKCAKFPIVTANMFITTNHTRLFTPYTVIERGGLRIMFSGVITDEILAVTRKEELIGSFVDVREAAKEIDVICDTYKTVDIDYTVVLSHIGFQKDCELAGLISESSGVDLIIGGHSHTLLTEPHFENSIPIVQVGTGTSNIGRIDLKFDSETHAVTDFGYRVVEVSDEVCWPDRGTQAVIDSYSNETNLKYSQVLTTFKRTLTHPERNQETELGNLFADVMQDGSSFDLMILGSGSMRLKELGPIVQIQDLKTFFPFDETLHLLEVTGDQLRRMVSFVLREEAFTGGHTEFYQFSKGMRIKWSRKQQKLLEFRFNGEDIKDDQRIKIGLPGYHYSNFEEFFNVPLDEVAANRKPRMVVSSMYAVYEELFSGMRELDSQVEGRIEVVE